MKHITFFLNGFGFDNLADFKKSSFGFMLSDKIIAGGSIAGILSTIAETIQNVFGINHAFFIAYSVLIVFEWVSGVAASAKRKEKHESRKIGRMLLKIASYCLPLYILNTFSANMEMPSMLGYEIDPFKWVYYTVLSVIIWQLLVSLLENLNELEIPFAKKLLLIINKKFYNQFGINPED